MQPTRFEDLNVLLAELVEGVRATLGERLVGVYLVGSFALGEADEHSDVDFLVVMRDELAEEEEAAVRALHGRLYAWPAPWAQHLEGSYAPAAHLRRLEPSPSRWLFLDNGASELVPDTHCNTAVTRWTLRQHGVALTGPAPPSVVDPVAPDDLRAEARRFVAEYVAWAHEPGGMNAWKQPYLVLTLCRLLHTLENGRVVTKCEAGEWALRTVDPEWASLIRQALADRPDPVVRYYQPAAADLAARTLAFAADARKLAGCE